MGLVVGVFCLIFLKEVPKLWKNKKYRELAAFLVLFFLAFVYTLVVVETGWGPNPNEWLTQLLLPLINFIEGL